jgi:hypothetical protein
MSSKTGLFVLPTARIGSAGIWALRVLAVFLFSTCLQLGSQAQRDLAVNNETWWGLMTSVQVSERWSVWNDAHYVNDLFIIGRTGITYHGAKNDLVTTVGYGYLALGAPFSNGELVRPEHRPWMQSVYRLPAKGKWSTSFRFRYDARFIADLEPERVAETFSFNHRWRFNNSLRYNLGSAIAPNTRLNATMLNESLITSGSGPNGFPFEHRTHFLGQLSHRSITYSLGYIGRYIVVDQNRARFNHGPVFWLSINLSALKAKTTTFPEFPGDHSD